MAVEIKKKRGRPKKVVDEFIDALEATPDLYKASIKVMGRVLESTGNSVKEALENFVPVGIQRGVSVLTVSHGGKSVSRVLTRLVTFRLFTGGKLTREITIKNLSLRFDI